MGFLTVFHTSLTCQIRKLENLSELSVVKIGDDFFDQNFGYPSPNSFIYNPERNHYKRKMNWFTHKTAHYAFLLKKKKGYIWHFGTCENVYTSHSPCQLFCRFLTFISIITSLLLPLLAHTLTHSSSSWSHGRRYTRQQFSSVHLPVGRKTPQWHGPWELLLLYTHYQWRQHLINWHW